MEYRDKLESARLITRFIVPGDEMIWLEYCQDPVATAFTRVPDMTAEEMARFVIEKTIARYAAGLMGLQALILKDTGEFVGKCGLLIQDVNGRKEMEIGYHLIRRHWGKGYAVEAARMFRNHGFDNYNVDSIVSLVHPQNIASQNVAKRNGMQLTDEKVEFWGVLHDIFRISRDKWNKLPN